METYHTLSSLMPLCMKSLLLEHIPCGFTCFLSFKIQFSKAFLDYLGPILKPLVALSVNSLSHLLNQTYTFLLILYGHYMTYSLLGDFFLFKFLTALLRYNGHNKLHIFRMHNLISFDTYMHYENTTTDMIMKITFKVSSL